MGWFQKNNQENTEQASNTDAVFGFRMLAVAYIGYTVYKVFSMYFAGGQDAPEIWMLVLSGLLGLGALVFAISSYRTWKKGKTQAEEAKLPEDTPSEEDESCEDCDDE